MSKTIKFDHSPTGEINLDNGVTSYADVFFLGALTLTSESIYPDKKTHYTKYATNKEGLEYAVMSAGELISALHNSIQAVSSYMAYVDAEEVKDDYQSIAWLIRGLSEMAEMVSVSREDMQHTLTFYDEIPKINQSTLLSSINEKVGIFNNSVDVLNSEDINYRNLSFVLRDAEEVAHLTLKAMESGVKL